MIRKLLLLILAVCWMPVVSANVSYETLAPPPTLYEVVDPVPVDAIEQTDIDIFAPTPFDPGKSLPILACYLWFQETCVPRVNGHDPVSEVTGPVTRV